MEVLSFDGCVLSYVIVEVQAAVFVLFSKICASGEVQKSKPVR